MSRSFVFHTIEWASVHAPEAEGFLSDPAGVLVQRGGAGRGREGPHWYLSRSLELPLTQQLQVSFSFVC